LVDEAVGEVDAIASLAIAHVINMPGLVRSLNLDPVRICIDIARFEPLDADIVLFGLSSRNKQRELGRLVTVPVEHTSLLIHVVADVLIREIVILIQVVRAPVEGAVRLVEETLDVVLSKLLMIGHKPRAEVKG